MTDLAPYPARLEWAAPGFPVGSVGWLIPFSPAYERFTRVFHSVTGGEGGVSWQELAASKGIRWHPEIQFADLGYDTGSAWLGSLDESRFRSLVSDLLAAGSGASCVLGLWEGEEWVTTAEHQGSGIVTVRQHDWERSGQLYRPGPVRVYRLFTSALPDVPKVGRYSSSGTAETRPPTLFWDAQGSFCVASDPDYDSTIVASDPVTQARILADSDLEAEDIPAAGSLLLHR